MCTLSGRASVVINLERGQLSHSLRFMARAWKWTVKRVRTFLGDLEADGMITTQTGTGQTLITVCRYEEYQFTPADAGTQTDTQKGTQRARKGHKKEEGNKEIKKISSLRDGWPPDAFEQWYALYRRKKNPHDARRAFAKVQAAGEITFDELMARTEAASREWATWPKDQQSFIPYPASWLNGGDYLSVSETAAGASRSQIAEPEIHPSSFSDGDWRERLAEHQRTGKWPAVYWGPPPGEPGCLVPSRVLGAQHG